jgi:hypothetical protein
MTMQPPQMACVEATVGMASRVLLLLPLQDTQHQHLDKFSQCINTDQLPGAIQLTMNGSSHTKASEIADVLLQDWYQQQADVPGNEGATNVNLLEFFTASTQRRLFVTAAMRQHVAALRTITTMPHIMQHVDAATLHSVLKQLVATGSGSTIRVLLEAEILHETAVMQLTSEAVCELLQASVEQGSSTCAELLCRLPAAQQLSSEALVELLQAAVEQNSSACAQLLVVLCKLPAANQLTAEQLVQLLQAAVVRDSVGCAVLLCQLPAAKQLPAEALVQLLQAAEVQRGGGCTETLCKLPATQQLPAEALLQLLQAAAACCKQTLRQATAPGGHASAPLQLLCRLPAAKQLLLMLWLSCCYQQWQQLQRGCRMMQHASITFAAYWQCSSS